MNANGSGTVRLTNDAAQDGQSAWSPDGTKIAFSTNRDGNLEIYVMNANGTGQTRLTNNIGFADLDPDWSPDGSKIAFSSNRDGNLEIYSMNADGTGRMGRSLPSPRPVTATTRSTR
jgi:TolB protein